MGWVEMHAGHYESAYDSRNAKMTYPSGVGMAVPGA